MGELWNWGRSMKKDIRRFVKYWVVSHHLQHNKECIVHHFQKNSWFLWLNVTVQEGHRLRLYQLLRYWKFIDNYCQVDAQYQLVKNGKWQSVRVEPQHLSWAWVENIHPFSSHSVLYNHTYTRCQTPIITTVLIRRLSLCDECYATFTLHFIVMLLWVFHCSTAACWARLCSASLCVTRYHLSSATLLHAATLKSVGVSIWSWIGGYLLAFCGIHHHPISPLSLNFLLLLPPHWLVPVALFLANDDPLMLLWNILEFRYFTDMIVVVFRFCNFIILLVAFLGSLLSFLDLSLSSKSTLFPNKDPSTSSAMVSQTVEQACLNLWELFFPSSILPMIHTPLFSALNLRKLPPSWKSSPGPNHRSLLASFHAF